MRGFLTEHGITVAKGFAPLRRALPELLEQPELNPLFVAIVLVAFDEGLNELARSTSNL